MKRDEKERLLNEQHTIIAEGKATKTEYKDQIAERQGWRDDINAAQAEIERLEAIEVEEEEGGEI